MAKKIIAYLIINIMLLNIGCLSLQKVAAEVPPTPTSPSISTPAPVVVYITSASLSASGSVGVGDMFRGTATVTNNSVSRVENVYVESSTSNAKIGIESFSTQIVGTLESGQSATVSFTYKVASGIESGETQVRFTSYADGEKQDSRQITVNVIGEPPKVETVEANFEILSATAPATISTATSEFKIGFRFSVRGSSANNVKVEWSASKPEAFEPKSAQVKTFGFMRAYSSEYYEFEITPTDKITQGSHTITIDITGTNATPLKYEIGIYVEKGADISGQGIKIISTEIPSSAKTGDKFQIKSVLHNTGSALRNITVELKKPNDGIANNSLAKIKIPLLEKNEQRDIVFDMLVTDKAEDNYNQFEIIITDSDGKEVLKHYTGLNIITDKSKDVTPSELVITPNIPATIKHSTDFKLSFTVKNNGGDAKNLTFSVSIPTGVMNRTVNTFSVPLLEAGESITKEITLFAVEEAAGKYCPFEITASGKDEEGHDITYAKQYTGISIDSIEEKPEFYPDLSVDYITIPYATGIERDFDVEIRLTNRGAAAQNVTMTLEPQSGLINKTSNIVKIDNMERDESSTSGFTFMATESAINGFNSINIKIEYSYKKADGTTASGETITQYSGLIVSNPKKEEETSDDKDKKKEMPVVIISRFDYGGEEVYGGKSFNFEIDLLNTHKNQIIKDLKITLSQEKGIFTPKSGSNTFFVEQLSPGGSVGQKIELIVKTDALPDSYGLTVTLEYKNANGDATTASEIINIPVQQETRFYIGEVPMINEVSLGDEVYVNIQFGNLGKSKICNVNLRFESDSFYDPDGGYFAGDIEAGKSASKAFYLTPTMPGMAMGKLVFVYENSIGEEFRDEIDISFMVMGDMAEGDFGLVDRPIMGMESEGAEIIGYDEDGLPIFAMDDGLLEENKGFFGWLFTDMGFLQWLVIIGAVMVVVAAIVIIIIVVKRKRDKIKDDDDDL